jgi:hypothetical protein
MVAFKVIHVVAMFSVVTLWLGGWIFWDLVARRGDRQALRTVDSVTQFTGGIGFVLFIVGVVAGFATALTGQIDLTAPWLLIAYMIVLSDFVVLRWSGTHVARVRAAQNDETADLRAVASSPRGTLTFAVLAAFWVLLVVDMIVKPFA